MKLLVVLIGTLSIWATMCHSRRILKNKKGSATVPVDRLADMAKEVENEFAPFSETTMSRLTNSVFGTTSGSRSTDAIIVNKSDYDFTLSNEPKCWTSGKWAPLLAPDIEIPAHSSSAYRAQTKGVYNGLKDCETSYLNSDGDTVGPQFQVTLSNPYLGPSKTTAWACCGVQISKVAGGGAHNRVRFTIENSYEQE